MIAIATGTYVCPLCWATFTDEIEAARHERDEDMQTYELDYDPSTNADTIWRGMTAEDRFWASTIVSDGCWEWTGHINARNRYGTLRVDGKTVKAHRFSYELHLGPVSPEVVVRHTCDNPRCVRPDHLELGTQADNVTDAIKRGRFTRAQRGASGRWEKPTGAPSRSDVAGHPVGSPPNAIGAERAASS